MAKPFKPVLAGQIRVHIGKKVQTPQTNICLKWLGLKVLLLIFISTH